MRFQIIDDKFFDNDTGYDIVDNEELLEILNNMIGEDDYQELVDKFEDYKDDCDNMGSDEISLESDIESLNRDIMRLECEKECIERECDLAIDNVTELDYELEHSKGVSKGFEARCEILSHTVDRLELELQTLKSVYNDSIFVKGKDA